MTPELDAIKKTLPRKHHAMIDAAFIAGVNHEKARHWSAMRDIADVLGLATKDDIAKLLTLIEERGQ